MPVDRSSRIAGARAASASRPDRRIRPIDRIRDREVFRRFRTSGSRARRGPLTVVALERLDSASAGLAFAMPRRVGSAVARNRLRRQLRAAASRARTPPGASGRRGYLVIVRPGAVGQPSPISDDRWPARSSRPPAEPLAECPGCAAPSSRSGVGAIVTCTVQPRPRRRLRPGFDHGEWRNARPVPGRCLDPRSLLDRSIW